MLLFSLVVVLSSTVLYHIKNQHPGAMSEDRSQPKTTSLLAGEKVSRTDVTESEPDPARRVPSAAGYPTQARRDPTPRVPSGLGRVSSGRDRMLVRVIFAEADIRKVELTTKPDTVDLLIGSLKDVLQINYEFKDPNFDNELCNLTAISELPERPTLKIIPVLTLVEVPVPQSTSSELSDTPSQADMEILSISSEESQCQWPEVFDMYIPKFSVDVEYSLEDARQLMVDEMKKKTPNGALIKQKMDLTFALRRDEVVKDKPDITQICQRWPALFTEHQVGL
ncbi:hypothetical protein N1851_002992 [Merluccius polli]|uniref:Uncharacterized protein n=1 Tax=Merluccius polli TaxID=89951 RepID=A0AA47NA90_MERPO|nr:hypothetical protein N1851_002992 [Merluccius polli]